MVHAVKQQKHHIDPDKHCTVGDHIRVLGEQFHRRGGKNLQQRNDHSGDQKGQADGGVGSLLRPLGLVGTYVLADKGRGCHGHALHGQHNELVQLVVAAPTGHTAGTEEIDVGLDKYIGKSGDHRLNAGRKANGKNMAHDPAVNGQIFPGQFVNVLGGAQQQQHQSRGHKLGQDRGISHACNAHFKHQHKHQIQNDIQNTGKHQEIQRPGSIAHRPENAAAHVVDQKAGETGKVDLKVGGGLRENILRRGHEAQHGPDPEEPDQGKQDAHNKGGSHGGFHGFMELLHIFCPEMHTDHHTGANRKAVEKEHQHVHDHGRGAHSGQGLGTNELAHDDGVYGIVKHLENVSQHQRQGKLQNLPDNVSFGHISCGGCCTVCHNVPSFFLLKKQRTTDNRETGVSNSLFSIILCFHKIGGESGI